MGGSPKYSLFKGSYEGGMWCVLWDRRGRVSCFCGFTLFLLCCGYSRLGIFGGGIECCWVECLYFSFPRFLAAWAVFSLAGACFVMDKWVVMVLWLIYGLSRTSVKAPPHFQCGGPSYPQRVIADVLA